MNNEKIHDVIIIGAGAAGVGLGVLFEKMGLKNYVILEKDSVGSSFKQWQPYTRFISPSFAGNAFNAVDLNAVSPDTSVAYSHKTEHPSGKQYAEYLELVVNYFKPTIKTGTDVTKIEKENDLFVLETSESTFTSKNLVWAGGEFQYPATPGIVGVEHCVHSSAVDTTADEHATIIGGYESGMDIAKEVLKQGKNVTLIDSGAPWEVAVSDASIAISPYTRDLIRPYLKTKQLTLISNTQVKEITKSEDGYLIHSDTHDPIAASEQPILATGFKNLPPVISSYFTETDERTIAITENDESTTTPGLFLIGPKVQHGAAIFCFIYKFRQRIPIVAETITERLQLDLDVPEQYLRSGMYLKDVSCCADECAC